MSNVGDDVIYTLRVENRTTNVNIRKVVVVR